MTTSNLEDDDDGWPQSPARRTSWLDGLAVTRPRRVLSCASSGSIDLDLGAPWGDSFDALFGCPGQDQRLPVDEPGDCLLDASVRDLDCAVSAGVRMNSIPDEIDSIFLNTSVPDEAPYAEPPAPPAPHCELGFAAAQHAVHGPFAGAGADAEFAPVPIAASRPRCVGAAHSRPLQPPPALSRHKAAHVPSPAPAPPPGGEVATGAAARARAARRRAISRWLEKRRRRRERGPPPARRYARRAELARSRKRVRGRFAQEGPVWRPANELA